MENPIKIADLGVPLFLETPICQMHGLINKGVLINIVVSLSRNALNGGHAMLRRAFGKRAEKGRTKYQSV